MSGYTSGNDEFSGLSGDDILKDYSEYLEVLDETAEWVIKDGVNFFLNNGDNAFIYELSRRSDFSQVRMPVVNQVLYNNDFRLSAKRYGKIGFNYDLMAVHTSLNNGVLYEFWVMAKYNLKGDFAAYRDMDFYLTRASDETKKREIVHSSDRFFSSYEVDGYTFEVPINDLKVRYNLRSHFFIDDFPQGEGWEKEVVVNRDGAYEFKKEKRFLFF